MDAPAPKTDAPKSEEAKANTPAKLSSQAAQDGKKAAVPAKTTLVQVASPKPSMNNAYIKPNTENQFQAKPQEDAPQPTKAAQLCPEGWKCVVEHVILTKTVYVTAEDDNSYKGNEGGYRQRRHARHN